MPFNAQTWIDDIVRTSHYILPDALPDHGDLDASPDDLVKALAAIRTTQVDANPAAALMPAIATIHPFFTRIKHPCNI